MKLYTRGGDAGQTSLVGGSRVAKYDPRVEAYGTLDELNALLGTVVASQPDAWLREILIEVQKDIFAAGAVFSSLGDQDAFMRVEKQAQRVLAGERTKALEEAVDKATAEVSALKNFILPGGSPCAALLHQARTVCRRAERRALAIEEYPLPDTLLAYINRLSDLLFALARRENGRAGVAEEPAW